MLLTNKVALITGTSRGIGKGIVEQFAANNSIIYANARTEGSIDEYVQFIREKYNVSITPLYFDVTDTTAAKDAILRIKKEQGKLDVLVNNAGIMKEALIGMISKDTMLEIFETNVFAVMDLIQLSSKLMLRQKSGSIINISSIVGVNGSKGLLAYSASKGAVISMTKAAAKELAPYNIRVNAIAPGMIDTELFRSINKEHPTELINNIGMGRLGTPEDVAKACVFLASDLSEYVTGQVLGVDGSTII